jgi:ABC-type branched-subunit amino acid transport system substrate-binding protein
MNFYGIFNRNERRIDMNMKNRSVCRDESYSVIVKREKCSKADCGQEELPHNEMRHKSMDFRIIFNNYYDNLKKHETWINCMRRWLNAAFLGVPLLWTGIAFGSDSIVVGQSLNMGPNSDGGGLRIQSAVKGYIESINAAGGVRGKNIELISMNDDGDLKKHAENLKEMVTRRGAVALLNCENEVVCRVTAETADQLKVPLIGPMSGSKTLGRSATPWVFQIRPQYEREAEVMVHQLKSMACFRIALVTDSVESEQVAAIKSVFARAGVDLIILPLSTNDKNAGSALLNSLEKGGYHAAVLVLSLISSEWLIDQNLTIQHVWPRTIAAPTNNHLQTLLNGFKNRAFGFTYVVPNPEIQSNLLVQEFQRTMDKFGAGHASTFLGMEAYINAKVLVEGLKRSTDFSANDIKNALSGMQLVDFGGFRVSFASGRLSGSDWVDVGVRSRHGSLLR